MSLLGMNDPFQVGGRFDKLLLG